QRVRRETVRAMDAGARDLAARPQAGQRAGAVEVGADAAAEVVRGRRDGEPVARWVEPEGLTGAPEGGEALGEVVDAGRVEPQMVEAAFVEPPTDRARDD